MMTFIKDESKNAFSNGNTWKYMFGSVRVRSKNRYHSRYFKQEYLIQETYYIEDRRAEERNRIQTERGPENRGICTSSRAGRLWGNGLGTYLYMARDKTTGRTALKQFRPQREGLLKGAGATGRCRYYQRCHSKQGGGERDVLSSSPLSNPDLSRTPCWLNCLGTRKWWSMERHSLQLGGGESVECGWEQGNTGLPPLWIELWKQDLFRCFCMSVHLFPRELSTNTWQPHSFKEQEGGSSWSDCSEWRRWRMSDAAAEKAGAWGPGLRGLVKESYLK